MIRRFVVVGVLLLMFVVSFSIYRNYQDRFQTVVVVSVSSGTRLSVYAGTGVHESTAYNAAHAYIGTSGPGKFRLKKGEYVYVVTGQGSGYQNQATSMTVDSTPIYISGQALNYTDSKLASLLPIEEPAIKTTISAQYPSQMNQYSVQAGKLYEQGNWYGAILVPADPTIYDTLRIVLKKESTGWKVITKPPEMVLGQPVYPDIPSDILTDLDSR